MKSEKETAKEPKDPIDPPTVNKHQKGCKCKLCMKRKDMAKKMKGDTTNL